MVLPALLGRSWWRRADGGAGLIQNSLARRHQHLAQQVDVNVVEARSVPTNLHVSLHKLVRPQDRRLRRKHGEFDNFEYRTFPVE